MKIGIMGLKESGKTTIFNILTGHFEHTDAAESKKGYNLGLINVPDQRLDTLYNIFEPKKRVYAKIQFIDFPGTIKDKKGFSDETLRRLNEIDALALILKGFFLCSPDEPVKDLMTILADMILSDLILAERALKRLEKDRHDQRLLDLIAKIHNHLSQDLFLGLLPMSEQEKHLIAGYTFTTRKPILVVLNSGEDSPAVDQTAESILGICAERDWEFLKINGALEEEIAQLDSEDQGEFLADLGVGVAARERFIQVSYKLLDMISFFTIGENEIKAWPVPNGTKAQKAAGKIHSDMERGFIRAEVVGFEDFIKCGDFQAARKKGLLRLEGKEYQVKDGDIITFRFNV